ncbi:MBL fold metallo-hydrolase [Nocardia jinanensis]|uniref:MBL fold metallo-hydrolase n=1 Tax=Nocardia jinanensis TaxID=382504 RepID=A0A917RZ28_9NOCA|nr:MBL fold metallo-hydrolase [Nocardia jinanensis]GGL45946.1 MBL fold metallo-hydrolase [Nocardia jinanensis]
MRLTPLGCLAAMPASGLASSGYLVEHGDTRVLLDAGPGVAARLSAVRTGRLSAVYVSHEHTDHILDLLVIGKTVLAERLRREDEHGPLILDEDIPPVPLYVPRGAVARLRALAGLYPVVTHPLLDRAFEVGFDCREYEPGERLLLGELEASTALLDHSAPNCGIRLESRDSSLVYTGDTGVTDALVTLAEGAGTLLSESTLRETDRSGHGHLSSLDAGRAARAAGVADLVLTHFSSPDPAEHRWHRDRAASVFDGPVSTARPDIAHPVPTSR